MVFAYALLQTPGFSADSIRALERADEIAVPDLFRAEFVDVLWRAVQARQVTPGTGRRLLWEAEALLTRVVPASVLWEDALALAIKKGHSAYDMLYVALAAQSGSRLISYDRRQKKLCPEFVLSVPEFLR